MGSPEADSFFAPAKTHSCSAKSPIYAVFRWCYKTVVQTDGPAFPDLWNGRVTRTETETQKVCVMSMRYLDRLAPAFLLFLGMIAAGATAGLGI